MIRLLVGALLAASLLLANPAAAGSLVEAETTAIFAKRSNDPYTLAVRAYVWGMPLVEAARIRMKRSAAGIPLNTIRHERTLADPSRRIGVGPNNDTVYSNAWLDLRDGPLILRTPDFGDRYYSFQIAAADSSSDLSFGRRTHGGRLPPLFIAGPGYNGPVPAGMLLARSPTRYTLLAGRTLVRDAADLPAVNALQDGISLSRADGSAIAPSTAQRPLLDPAENIPADLAFMAILGNVLRDWGMPQPDYPGQITSLRRIGLSPQAGFRLSKLTAADRAAVAAGLADGRAIVERKSRSLGFTANGWTMNLNGPRFGSDYLLRAGVAKDQIFVTVPEEAVYPVSRVDADGRALDGARSYLIHISPGEIPPVKAFWSITMYDDHGFLVANPIGRYSIGDRTSGLLRNSDGSIDIRVQHSAPSGSSDANWLPAPAGPFYLMMRAYIPDAKVLRGEWQPPSVQRLN